MKKTFFTVGPSQLYPTVPKHIANALAEDIPSLSHRSQKFMNIYRNTSDKIKEILSIPDSHRIFFTSCALEGMERVIQNTVNKYSYHFVNGSFSREFYQIAVDLNKRAERHDAPNGKGFTFDTVTIPKKMELICLVQNETSTGVAIPMEYIYNVKSKYPSMLMAIDIVSSAPYVPIDFSLVDIAFFSVQKGFGLPAGLGVVIVNNKALEKAHWLTQKNISTGSYHSFSKLLEFSEKQQTRETPNVMNIYLLGKVIEDMLIVGLERIRKDTEKKAKLLYDFFDNHHPYKPFVAEPFRSKTTIVIDVEGNSEKLVTHLEKKGFILAKGYGKRKDIHIRIANFPAHSITDVTNLLKCM